MKSHLDKIDELGDEVRATNQRLSSQDQDARQPRPAMEADVPADKKTRERTEGAATAVQAKHGDSCSANRVDPDSMCSTIFGVKAEPPALPCRDDVLIDNGAAVPNVVSLTLGDAHTNSHRWLAPYRQNLYSDNDHPSPDISLALPGRRDTFEGFITTAVFGGQTTSKPPSGRGSLKQNRVKTWCSISASRQLFSTPAHIWKRGARCFVGRFTVERWKRLQRLCGGWMTEES